MPVADLTTVVVPPPGWFALDVMREEPRKWDWVALLVDVDPGDLAHCRCDFPARFYVHPKEYRPGARTAHQCWLRIPGKHRNRGAAWDAFRGIDRPRSSLGDELRAATEVADAFDPALAQKLRDAAKVADELAAVMRSFLGGRGAG